MNLEFRPFEAADLARLGRFYCRRPNRTCDSMPFDSFLWRDYYQVNFAVSGDRAVQWLMRMRDGTPCSAMPICDAEDLQESFEEIKNYFNRELGKPLYIQLADEEAVLALGLLENPEFTVTEDPDARDYLYSADALRTLSGKKLHKKKNHINAFLREYGERCEYRRLQCGDRDAMWEFLDTWRAQKGENVEEHLDYEVRGIHELLKNCNAVPVSMAGVFIDGALQAFTVGSYNTLEEMAIIHIEKANAEIRGLYQFINQQFLIHEFPQAKLVNREDDLGEPGLRRAKESYDPCGYARKYVVIQKI